MTTTMPVTTTISVAATDLANALNACRPYVANQPGAGTPAVAFHSKEGQLFVSTADHQSAIQLAVPCDGEWPESVAMPAETLISLMTRVDNRILLELSHDHVRLNAGAFSATLPRLSTDTIPAVDRDIDDRDATSIRLPIPDALRILGTALLATARTPSSPPALKGVLLETIPDALRAIGTDGFRLIGTLSDHADIAPATTPLPTRTAILPRNTILALIDATAQTPPTEDDPGWLTLRLGQHGYRIEGATWRLVGSYLPGPYPDWESVVAPHTTAPASCIVSRKELRAALRRAAVLADPQADHPVLIAIRSDEIAVQTQHSTGASLDIVPAQTTPACIGQGATLNTTLLLPLLNAFSGDRVALSLHRPDHHAPLILTAPGESTVALIMPIKS